MKRHIEFDGLCNFRDMGGYAGADGRTVRWGRLYRSDSLSKLKGDGWAQFADLGVRTVIDLRYPWEIERKGRIPEGNGYAYYNLSIEHQPYNQVALDPSVDPAAYLAERYAEVATDGVKELRNVLEIIAAADNAPIVFHCASGKDRTGIVAALVLTLLGVSEEDIVADFALTGLATERLAADWHRDYPDKKLNWPGYGQAPAQLMRLFLDGLAARYGSVRGYVTSGLGVGEDTISAMRSGLLAG